MTLAMRIPALLLALAACLSAPRAADGMHGSHDGRDGYHYGSGSDHIDGRNQSTRDRALQFHGQLASRLSFLSGRFEGGQNPRALELADKIRSLLALAMIEIQSGRPEASFP